MAELGVIPPQRATKNQSANDLRSLTPALNDQQRSMESSQFPRMASLNWDTLQAIESYCNINAKAVSTPEWFIPH